MLKVAINWFGRIGINAFKVAVDKHSDNLEIVALNDLTTPSVLAHLLKYDSAYGVWNHEVSSDETNIIVDNKKYSVLAEKEPAKLRSEERRVGKECRSRWSP